MYVEQVAARYDPHSNPEWGLSPPTSLSKVGKYGKIALVVRSSQIRVLPLANHVRSNVPLIKLTCIRVYRRNFFNIESTCISMHILLWMEVELDLICMDFAEQ